MAKLKTPAPTPSLVGASIEVLQDMLGEKEATMKSLGAEVTEIKDEFEIKKE